MKILKPRKIYSLAFGLLAIWVTNSQLHADTLTVGGNYQQPVYVSATGFHDGNIYPATGGDVYPSSFSIGAGPSSQMILYCVDLLHDVRVPQTFDTLTYDPSASAYNTWNHSGRIINDASAMNPGGLLANGDKMAWLMKTYAPSIHDHIVSNTNVGTVNGVTLEGTASDAALALNALLWKEVYGPDFELDLNFNNQSVIDNYFNIVNAGIGSLPVSEVFWFNLPDQQQGMIGYQVPAPSTLEMGFGLSLIAGLIWRVRSRKFAWSGE